LGNSEKELGSPQEIEAMLIQHFKDSAIQNLLSISRELGVVEGMILCTAHPGEELLDVQRNLQRVYDNLLEKAEIVELQEVERKGIGGE
jgi:hypothetical protein